MNFPSPAPVPLVLPKPGSLLSAIGSEPRRDADEPDTAAGVPRGLGDAKHARVRPVQARLR